MAATASGAQLTELHRQAQLAIRSSFTRELLRLWPLIKLDQLDESAGEWIGFVTELILQFRQRSAGRALSYYDEFRNAEIGEPLPDRPLYRNLDAPVPGAIRTSLLVTGPIGMKSRIAKGINPDIARAKALVDVAGAASRHVLDGGRTQLVESVKKDSKAVQYARVTDGKPCYFCAMLASRGPIYRSASTAVFATNRSATRAGREFHDHCGCSVEPGFSKDAEWPGRGRDFAKIWKDSTAGKGGKAALNAFRSAYEAQLKSDKEKG
jgi:hypothetical protein